MVTFVGLSYLTPCCSRHPMRAMAGRAMGRGCSTPRRQRAGAETLSEVKARVVVAAGIFQRRRWRILLYHCSLIELRQTSSLFLSASPRRLAIVVV